MRISVSAPGRANLLGEYTDVNDGFVLPVALDLRTTVEGTRGGDRLVLRSDAGDGVVEVDLRTGEGPRAGWGRYVTAVVQVLRDEGLPLHGVEGRVTSDVPLSAGLSSSAALEVAVALAVLAEPVDAVRLARLCQRAENEGVGVQSGIMDQLASAAAREGHALFLDCRSLAVEHVPVPADLRVLVLDSGVPRDLTSSAYNERRRQCEDAAGVLGVPALRDATPELLQQHASRLDDVVLRRARHVVTEDARVVEAVAALRDDDRERLRALFAASHASLRDDFEVTVPELDLLVELASGADGVVATRMTGAGFGGCTVALVTAARADDVRDDVLSRYTAQTGRPARGWVSHPAAGAA